MKIKALSAREILDSRGFPTLEAQVHLDNGKVFSASVPSGASKGSNEAQELRDGGDRYEGKGVLGAVYLVENRLSALLVGKEIDPFKIDELLIQEGGPKLAKIGGNTALSLSMATVRAYAWATGQELFLAIGELAGNKGFSLPRCLYNLMNGGMHAHNGLAVQEFLVSPRITVPYAKNLEQVVAIYHRLKRNLESAGYSTGLGDEGGFAPFIEGDFSVLPEEKVFEFILQALKECGLGGEVELGIDAAASTFYDKENNCYILKGEKVSPLQLMELYARWRTKYGLVSIEDGFAENDVAGWQKLYSTLGTITQLVGDDLCVTDSERIRKAVREKCINAVIIKPNQIGTVTGALKAAAVAKELGCKRIVSHRSGETNDSFIADFAVGVGAEEFKAGAPAREERVAKYNRLLEIEELLSCRS